MATTITAKTIVPVLRAAADRVAGLPYVRVVRTDVHHALYQSASQYDIAQAALDTLAAHLKDPGWLTHWADPQARDQVAWELRAAASAAERAERSDYTLFESADQSFDWTRGLDRGVRSLITTWLEVGDRACLSSRPVPLPGGEG